MTIQKKVFDFFLFTSFYIAVCAVVMVNQTYLLLINKSVNLYYLAFVFLSTVCSYNFHWLLSHHQVNPSSRLSWSLHHKGYHLILSVTGLLFSFYFFLHLVEHWFWLGIGAFLTLLYSAPKIPLAPFHLLKKVAYGKTVFLSFVWTYVTAILPLIVENSAWTEKSILFCAGQFFLIFSICLIFDYRDRADDEAEGIKSMIHIMTERGINFIFNISLLLSICFFLILKNEGLPWIIILILILPVFITGFLFNHAKKNFSDYLYYFILDGLMMLSGLILLIIHSF